MVIDDNNRNYNDTEIQAELYDCTDLKIINKVFNIKAKDSVWNKNNNGPLVKGKIPIDERTGKVKKQFLPKNWILNNGKYYDFETVNIEDIKETIYAIYFDFRWQETIKKILGLDPDLDLDNLLLSLYYDDYDTMIKKIKFLSNKIKFLRQNSSSHQFDDEIREAVFFINNYEIAEIIIHLLLFYGISDDLEKRISPKELYVYKMKINCYLKDIKNYRNYNDMLFDYDYLDEKSKKGYEKMHNQLAEKIKESKELKRRAGHYYFRHADAVYFKQKLKEEENKNYEMVYVDYERGQEEISEDNPDYDEVSRDQKIRDNVKDNGNKWSSLSRMQQYNIKRVINNIKIKDERIREINKIKKNERKCLYKDERKMFKDMLITYNGFKTDVLVDKYYELFQKLPEEIKYRLVKRTNRFNLAIRYKNNGYIKALGMIKVLEKVLKIDLKGLLLKVEEPKRKYEKKEKKKNNEEEEKKENDELFNDLDDRKDVLQESENENDGLHNEGLPLNEDEEEEEEINDKKDKKKKKGKKNVKDKEGKKQKGKRWTKNLIMKIDNPQLELKKRMNTFNLYLSMNLSSYAKYMHNLQGDEQRNNLSVMAKKYNELNDYEKDILRAQKEFENQRYETERDIFKNNYIQFPDLSFERTILEKDQTLYSFLGKKKYRSDDKAKKIKAE